MKAIGWVAEVIASSICRSSALSDAAVGPVRADRPKLPGRDGNFFCSSFSSTTERAPEWTCSSSHAGGLRSTGAPASRMPRPPIIERCSSRCGFCIIAGLGSQARVALFCNDWLCSNQFTRSASHTAYLTSRHLAPMPSVCAEPSWKSTWGLLPSDMIRQRIMLLDCTDVRMVFRRALHQIEAIIFFADGSRHSIRSSINTINWSHHSVSLPARCLRWRRPRT
jgi:hypothetical protein